MGDANESGQRHGFGLEVLDSSYSFAGHFQENKKHGRGCIHRGDRFQFRGEFADDQAQGPGEAFIKDAVILRSVYVIVVVLGLIS